MKTISLCSCLCLLFIGLSYKKEGVIATESLNKDVSKTKISSIIKNFSILDSLKKFGGGKDTLLLDDANDATLFVGRTNNKNFGVYIVSEKSLQFYQQHDNNYWAKSTVINYDNMFSYVSCEDVNGDNVNDIIISSLNGSAGNTDDTVFLYDRKMGAFNYNECYNLTNLSYDKKGKFIRSSWYSGAVHCQTKMKYIIKDECLEFALGVTFCPDQEYGKTGTLYHFKIVDGQRVNVDSITGKSGRLWRKFENEFWNSKNDMIE